MLTKIRKCGRVVCASCSSTRTTYLPFTYVVGTPNQRYLKSPHTPHRTCDECANELLTIRSAILTRSGNRSRSNSGRSAKSNASATSRTSSSHSGPRLRSVTVVEEIEQEQHGLSESSSAQHFAEQSEPNYIPESVHHRQLFSGNESPGSTQSSVLSQSPNRGKDRANRMIIYTLTLHECRDLDPCTICLQEFKAHDRVSRLECQCVYHEKCILGWFSRKGAGHCPLHSPNV